MKYYVYIHLLNDEVFYVGKGKGNRAYQFNPIRRNKLWNDFVKDDFEKITVKIIKEFDTSKEAIAFEKELTEYYWSLNQAKCCDIAGYSKYGEKNAFYNKKHSEETKRKISEKNKNKEAWNKNKTNIYSEDTLKKMSIAKKNKKYSDEVNKKKGRKGEKNGMYGKSHSDEARKKISESYYTRRLCKKTCVICNTVFEARNGRNKYCENCKGRKK